jgi:GntR family transcriptional repressor for pyruvate dehydrogenase complex
LKAFEQLTREPRLADKVAATILEMILTEGTKVGDRLPSERELSDQFGVSRTVVREAIRTLAAKGVLEVRTGHGVRIVAVPAGTVSESLRLFIRSATLDYPRLAEVRATLEIEIAGLAAQRVTEEGVELLRANVSAMEAAVGDVDRMSQLDLDFHRAIAVSTQNDLFLLLLDSIGEGLLEIRRRLFADSPKGEQMHTAVRAHREILAGDAGASESGRHGVDGDHRAGGRGCRVRGTGEAQSERGMTRRLRAPHEIGKQRDPKGVIA